MPIAKIKQNKERRQKLLESAVKLFIEKGYFNTSIRDIIVLSEIGTGTFYNYFIDKEDVLKALLEEFADKIISSIKVYYQEETDIYVRFVETKRVTMEVFIQNEALSEIYSRVAGASAPIDQCLQQFENRLIQFYTHNIEYGIKLGVFNNIPVSPIAHSILAIEKFLLYKWVVLKAITKEEMIEMVVSFHETLAQGILKTR
ncbi:MAG: TetR/AcrR family transcriptional regulator [Syntrophomonadaceae bacterium]|jgi:AcrR family transcriptional regulator|nr:TetR/AcrR family transcriptional regulator [Syntrophomonadaceae bacterium]NLO22244.1 TetR/AcrR family transcriptional regulator [Syntrophomonadaceae bacterium]